MDSTYYTANEILQDYLCDKSFSGMPVCLTVIFSSQQLLRQHMPNDFLPNTLSFVFPLLYELDVDIF